MEARQEEAEPGTEDLAHHAGAYEREPDHPPPRLEAGNAVLAKQLEHPGGAVYEEVAGDEEHDLGLHFPPLEPSHVPGGVEPRVVGDALVLDLLDRVPPPH